MNLEEQRPSTSGEGTEGAATASTDVAAEAVHTALRRRLILGGMVGVPTTLAVMKPVKTLAKAYMVCSFSGWQSFQVNPTSSAAPQVNCTAGYTTAHWEAQAQNWPATATSSGTLYKVENSGGTQVQVYQNTTFAALFGSGPPQPVTTILSNSSSAPGAYLTALFNANSVTGYPYTVTQIYQYWTNPQLLGTGVTQAQVASFFQQLNTRT